MFPLELSVIEKVCQFSSSSSSSFAGGSYLLLFLFIYIIIYLYFHSEKNLVNQERGGE